MKDSTLSVHQRLLSIDRSLEVTMSSILIRNESVPLFEEKIGMLDFDWLLRVSQTRKWGFTEDPTIIRHVDGSNLSLDEKYRLNDLTEAIRLTDFNRKARAKLFGSYARYWYVKGNGSKTRWALLMAGFTWKNMLYFFTSFFPGLMRIVVKRFGVFG